MKNVFPKNINDYYFQNEFKPFSSQKDNLFGIYKNNEGKKIFIKMFPKKFLWNILFQKKENIIKELSTFNKSNKFVFTKYLGKTTFRNKTIFMYDYINGKTINNFSSKSRASYYNSVINFLHVKFSNDFLNKKNALGKRSLFFYYVFSTHLLFRSILNGPSKFRKSISIYTNLIRLHSRLVSTDLVVSHRDLFDSNIIISKQKIHILDLEKICICPKEEDISILLIRYWADKTFVNYFMKLSEFSKILSNKKSQKRLSFFMLMYALSDMATTSDLTVSELNDFINFALILGK